MTTLKDFAARVEDKAPISNEELDTWIVASDPANARHFYSEDAATTLARVRRVSKTIVDAYLNNPHLDEVPLRRKTRFCLVLNNFALYQPVRPAVFESLDDLTNIFETAIREEGTMPFDSELGRMSEHVLVLLMRVTNYKLQAAAVHEFAEYNTQFAIQLLLAILLKEPAYEFELRCNCIHCLYGFTLPQAFFSAGSTIEEQSCAKFTEKINFMLNLMLRLRAVEVVSDVLDCMSPESPTVMAAFASIMRTIMNIFKYCSSQATQWRQHILLSTSFLDSSVVALAQFLLTKVQAALQHSPCVVPQDELGLLNLAFKFGAFASYHLDEVGLELRLYCTFFHDAFQLSLRPIVADAKLSGRFMLLFVNLMHWMCNVEVLGGEQRLPTEDMLPELHSAALRQTIEHFLRREVMVYGLPFLQAWHQQFQRGDKDALLARDSVTYNTIDKLFTTLEQELSKAATTTTATSATAGSSSNTNNNNNSNAAANHVAAAAAAPAPAATSSNTSKGRLLGDIPSLKKPKPMHKISIDNAAVPVRGAQPKGLQQQTQTQKAGGATYSYDSNAALSVDPAFLCALTHHVMKNPVSSPYGHTFEKEAILSWLEQNGSVCPITGKTLMASQLTPNKEIAARIMQQVVTQSMQAQAAQDDADLYNF